MLAEPGPGTAFLLDWSPDGEHILFLRGGKVFAVSLSGDELDDREPSPLVETAFQEAGGRLSPDGQWLAYVSNASGANEIYVQRFSGGAKLPVSTDGGVSPRWAPDGSELYYVAGERTLTAVPFEPGELGLPQSLFELPDRVVSGSPGRSAYSTVDGKRFLIRVREGGAPSSITWVLNWTAELEH